MSIEQRSNDSLDKVARELAQYQHPFFEFSVVEAGDNAGKNEDGVDVCVRCTLDTVHSPEYHFSVSEREIAHPQFRWSFQGLLYGNLNDYMVELFTRSPGD